MSAPIKDLIHATPVSASAPCRIDMGGTLDISTFYYPLRNLNPCTFNIAIDLRTEVQISANDSQRVKVSANGFESAEFLLHEAPFSHPLGLIFNIAAYFNAEGTHIQIHSASPPRSGLGGSSVAAVALMAAFSTAICRTGAYRQLYRREIAILAHALEESITGLPCGLQDQLAAAYGGMNAWQWHGRVKEGVFEKESIIKNSDLPEFRKHLLIAYCGLPHESVDINGKWIRRFLAGQDRHRWRDIIQCTQRFIKAMAARDIGQAVRAMNEETSLRMEMTPDVFDDLGYRLRDAAVRCGCAARFTGAGGGGCVWALGEAEDIARLEGAWGKILSTRNSARLLDFNIDTDGLAYDHPESR